ncbi:MAG: hypothetical protein JST71_09025 [Bacteroidetes bacterium]|jgi:hypothetical protein|nr:hypothetical protein [Bacteroidota bacterium]MBX7239754.1 hypothetical protein [Bacteroidia bacterium]MCC7513898.1 hypothetical protein [Bacteroidia bacterium]MCW5920271.1 hypothetical protein [Bacteroidota bacterium]HCI57622.1 hypothetical protein [Bacteroidota bacterium]
MKEFLRANWIVIAGTLTGAVGGYLYWKFVGCHDGSCAITSNALNSSFYGAVVGGLFMSLFQKQP